MIFSYIYDMVPLVVPMKSSKMGGVDITTHGEIERGEVLCPM